MIRNFNADGFSSLYPKYKGGQPPSFGRTSSLLREGAALMTSVPPARARSRAGSPAPAAAWAR